VSVLCLETGFILDSEMANKCKSQRSHNKVASGGNIVQVMLPLGGLVYARQLSHGLVTVREAATLLRVTTRTVWNMVARGALRPRRRGSRVFFVLSAVRARQRFNQRRYQHGKSQQAGH
jgi:excisionase family DNA binding protein